jgi:hypothetical protein
LRNPAERVTIGPVFEVPGFQHVSYKPEETVVADFLCQYPEKDLVIQAAEAVGDISFDKPGGPGPGVVYLPQCGATSPEFPEPVRGVRELRLIKRFQQQADHFAD